MRKSRQYCIIAAVIFLTVAAVTSYAGEKSTRLRQTDAMTTSFTIAELEHASPFDRNIIRRTFDTVAQMMNIEVNPDIPLPDIVVSSQIPVAKLPEYVGVKLNSNRFNYFSHVKNTIALVRESRIHHLAHELTHYFQFHYHIKGDITQLIYDPEPEAVRIQNRFRQTDSGLS